jgi:ADP-ribose pyrophosphatase YjhB (NUDIX family)
LPPTPTRTEFSAGGIVFQRSEKGPLVAFLLDPYGKWTFPKGHVRRAAGEPAEGAACRETEEEVGISGLKIIEKLGTAEIWFHDRFKYKGALVHKYITYFLIEAPAGTVGYPEIKEKIRAIAWVPLGEVLDFSSYENLAPVIRRAVRRIEQLTRHA